KEVEPVLNEGFGDMKDKKDWPRPEILKYAEASRLKFLLEKRDEILKKKLEARTAEESSFLEFLPEEIAREEELVRERLSLDRLIMATIALTEGAKPGLQLKDIITAGTTLGDRLEYLKTVISKMKGKNKKVSSDDFKYPVFDAIYFVNNRGKAYPDMDKDGNVFKIYIIPEVRYISICKGSENEPVVSIKDGKFDEAKWAITEGWLYEKFDGKKPFTVENCEVVIPAIPSANKPEVSVILDDSLRYSGDSYDRPKKEDTGLVKIGSSDIHCGKKIGPCYRFVDNGRAKLEIISEKLTVKNVKGKIEGTRFMIFNAKETVEETRVFLGTMKGDMLTPKAIEAPLQVPEEKKTGALDLKTIRVLREQVEFADAGLITRDWEVTTYMDSRGIRTATVKKADDGKEYLELSVNLKGKDKELSKGEVYCAVPKEYKETVSKGVKISVKIKVPAAFAKNGYNGIQVFAKNAKGDSQYSDWMNVNKAGEWIEISYVPTTLKENRQGHTDPAFNPREITAIGVKFAMNDNTSDTVKTTDGDGVIEIKDLSIDALKAEEKPVVTQLRKETYIDKVPSKTFTDHVGASFYLPWYEWAVGTKDGVTKHLGEIESKFKELASAGVKEARIVLAIGSKLDSGIEYDANTGEPMRFKNRDLAVNDLSNLLAAAEKSGIRLILVFHDFGIKDDHPQALNSDKLIGIDKELLADIIAKTGGKAIMAVEFVNEIDHAGTDRELQKSAEKWADAMRTLKRADGTGMAVSVSCADIEKARYWIHLLKKGDIFQIHAYTNDDGSLGAAWIDNAGSYNVADGVEVIYGEMDPQAANDPIGKAYQTGAAGAYLWFDWKKPGQTVTHRLDLKYFTDAIGAIKAGKAPRIVEVAGKGEERPAPVKPVVTAEAPAKPSVTPSKPAPAKAPRTRISFEDWKMVPSSADNPKYDDNNRLIELPSRAIDPITGDRTDLLERFRYDETTGYMNEKTVETTLNGIKKHVSVFEFADFDDKGRPHYAKETKTHCDEDGNLTDKKDVVESVIAYDENGDEDWSLLEGTWANGDYFHGMRAKVNGRITTVPVNKRQTHRNREIEIFRNGDVNIARENIVERVSTKHDGKMEKGEDGKDYRIDPKKTEDVIDTYLLAPRNKEGIKIGAQVIRYPEHDKDNENRPTSARETKTYCDERGREIPSNDVRKEKKSLINYDAEEKEHWEPVDITSVGMPSGESYKTDPSNPKKDENDRLIGYMAEDKQEVFNKEVILYKTGERLTVKGKVVEVSKYNEKDLKSHIVTDVFFLEEVKTPEGKVEFKKRRIYQEVTDDLNSPTRTKTRTYCDDKGDLVEGLKDHEEFREGEKWTFFYGIYANGEEHKTREERDAAGNIKYVPDEDTTYSKIYTIDPAKIEKATKNKEVTTEELMANITVSDIQKKEIHHRKDKTGTLIRTFIREEKKADQAGEEEWTLLSVEDIRFDKFNLLRPDLPIHAVKLTIFGRDVENVEEGIKAGTEDRKDEMEIKYIRNEADPEYLERIWLSPERFRETYEEQYEEPYKDEKGNDAKRIVTRRVEREGNLEGIVLINNKDIRELRHYKIKEKVTETRKGLEPSVSEKSTEKDEYYNHNWDRIFKDTITGKYILYKRDRDGEKLDKKVSFNFDEKFNIIGESVEELYKTDKENIYIFTIPATDEWDQGIFYIGYKDKSINFGELKEPLIQLFKCRMKNGERPTKERPTKDTRAEDITLPDKDSYVIEEMNFAEYVPQLGRIMVYTTRSSLPGRFWHSVRTETGELEVLQDCSGEFELRKNTKGRTEIFRAGTAVINYEYLYEYDSNTGKKTGRVYLVPPSAIAKEGDVVKVNPCEIKIGIVDPKTRNLMMQGIVYGSMDKIEGRKKVEDILVNKVFGASLKIARDGEIASIKYTPTQIMTTFADSEYNRKHADYNLIRGHTVVAPLSDPDHAQYECQLDKDGKITNIFKLFYYEGDEQYVYDIEKGEVYVSKVGDPNRVKVVEGIRIEPIKDAEGNITGTKKVTLPGETEETVKRIITVDGKTYLWDRKFPGIVIVYDKADPETILQIRTGVVFDDDTITIKDKGIVLDTYASLLGPNLTEILGLKGKNIGTIRKDYFYNLMHWADEVADMTPEEVARAKEMKDTTVKYFNSLFDNSVTSEEVFDLADKSGIKSFGQLIYWAKNGHADLMEKMNIILEDAVLKALLKDYVNTASSLLASEGQTVGMPELFFIYMEQSCDVAADTAKYNLDKVDVKERIDTSTAVLKGKLSIAKAQPQSRWNLIKAKARTYIAKGAILYAMILAFVALVTAFLSRLFRRQPRAVPAAVSSAVSTAAGEGPEAVTPAVPEVTREIPESRAEPREKLPTESEGKFITVGDLTNIEKALSDARKKLVDEYDKAHVILNPYGSIGKDLGRAGPRFVMRWTASAAGLMAILIGIYFVYVGGGVIASTITLAGAALVIGGLFSVKGLMLSLQVAYQAVKEKSVKAIKAVKEKGMKAALGEIIENFKAKVRLTLQKAYQAIKEKGVKAALVSFIKAFSPGKIIEKYKEPILNLETKQWWLELTRNNIGILFKRQLQVIRQEEAIGIITKGLGELKTSVEK
ncbi:MAG: hypothetical protein PHP46_03890, partial [Candidatus Omnitrophica bacterium]|nr:hypothetical protein [Candidatus Omnitrophota bacterium]